MKQLIFLLTIFIYSLNILSAQVFVNYDDIGGKFGKEDLYRFTIFNRTSIDVETVIKGQIMKPDGEVIYQFKLPFLMLKVGKKDFDLDDFKEAIVLVDNYTEESIMEGFTIQCKVVHPQDTNAVIASYETYFIPVEVTLSKPIKQKKDFHSTMFFGNRPNMEVINSSQDFLYIGVEHKLQAEVEGIPASRIKILAHNYSATVKRDTLGVYWVTPSNHSDTNDFAQLTMYAYDETGQVFGKQFHWKLKRLPRPTPSLEHSYRRKLSIDEFKEEQALVANFINIGAEVDCKIISFDVLRISESGERFEVKNERANFNKELLALISETKHGDIFIFSNIKCVFPGFSFPRPLTDLVFRFD